MTSCALCGRRVPGLDPVAALALAADTLSSAGRAVEPGSSRTLLLFGANDIRRRIDQYERCKQLPRTQHRLEMKGTMPVDPETLAFAENSPAVLLDRVATELSELGSPLPPSAERAILIDTAADLMHRLLTGGPGATV